MYVCVCIHTHTHIYGKSLRNLLRLFRGLQSILYPQLKKLPQEKDENLRRNLTLKRMTVLWGWPAIALGIVVILPTQLVPSPFEGCGHACVAGEGRIKTSFQVKITDQEPKSGSVPLQWLSVTEFSLFSASINAWVPATMIIAMLTLCKISSENYVKGITFKSLSGTWYWYQLARIWRQNKILNRFSFCNRRKAFFWCNSMNESVKSTLRDKLGATMIPSNVLMPL